MKNYNEISAGLKSLSSSEASAILEELQTPEKIMCISAVHIDDFGEDASFEYFWKVPEHLWGEIQEGDFVEVENCSSVDTVRVTDIFWTTPENAEWHLDVLKVDRLRLKTPLYYLEGLKWNYCWYKEEIPPCTITYNSIKEVKKILLNAAKAGVFSLCSYHLLTGACFSGMLDFLNEHAPYLGEILEWNYDFEDAYYDDRCHQPYKLTPEFLELIKNY